MSDISIESVDERDSGWEDPSPRFRVYLHGSGETSTYGWTATYDIVGADVLQVIDWAQTQAGDARTFAVALVCDDAAREHMSPGYGRGLVWLVGADGNDNTEDDPAGPTALAHQRMLLRRKAPLMVPETDKMPDGLPSVAPETIARLDRAQRPW